MAGRIHVSTREEQRSVIRFLWAKGSKPTLIHKQMSEVYGDTCLSLRHVYIWCKKFADGRQNVIDESRSGRPRTSCSDENVAAVDAIIQNDRRQTVRDIAKECEISIGTAYDIIHDRLNYRKVSARWVPKQLTKDQEGIRMAFALKHLERYHLKGESFLQRIVTGDETWVHHFTPETKQSSMVWKHSSSPAPIKFKINPSAGKVMAIVFWDCAGVLLIDFVPKGSTVTSTTYCGTLTRLRAAIRRKRPTVAMESVILLHDNARPHSAHLTMNKIASFGWELLDHPPYSPDLAPSDFHLFGPLKKHLAGSHFSTDEQVMKEVRHWLNEQDKTFYEKGIQNLVGRWDKCINACGSYIEK
jgi:[histone H3]-lysine36 N-dimethyltransferase SETMAR